jgi:hypothetical protein
MTNLENEWTPPGRFVLSDPQATVLVLRDVHDQPWAWITSAIGYHRLEIWDGAWRTHGVFDDVETAKVIGRIAASAALVAKGEA